MKVTTNASWKALIHLKTETNQTRTFQTHHTEQPHKGWNSTDLLNWAVKWLLFPHAREQQRLSLSGQMMKGMEGEGGQNIRGKGFIRII